MCFSAEVSIITFLIGLVGSICLITVGNKKYKKENTAFGIFLLLIAGIQLHRPERKMRQKSIKKIKNHSFILSNGANAPRRALYYLTTTTCYGCSG